jgi:nitroreductase
MTIVPEIEARRARRAYAPRPVEDEVLNRILTAATLAPSCANKQPWRFVVCRDGAGIDEAREGLSGGNYWAKNAPVLLIVLTADELDCNLSDSRHYAQFDTGMATMNLLLQATREGLYAHPMAGFSPEKVRETFSIGDEARVITMIALGYPGDIETLNEKHRASESGARERLAMNDVVSFGTWPGIRSPDA